MKSSRSEFLSWKKGRNKHNLNYHSRRVAACCSGIKQASRQEADLKYRQPPPKSQAWHLGEVELPLARDQPLFLHAGHHSPSGQKAQPAPKVAGLLGRCEDSAHSQGKTFPEQADPAAVLPLLRNSNGGNWRLSWAGGSGCPAASGGQQPPHTACHRPVLRGVRELPGCWGLRASILSPGFLEHLHCGSAAQN